MSLRKKGASLATAVSFWLANPTLNPAVLLFLAAAVGWKWAALRLVVGLGLVIAAVAVTLRFAATSTQTASHLPEPSPARGGSLLLAWFNNAGRMFLRMTPEYFLVTGLMGAVRAFVFPTGALHMGFNPLLWAGLAVGGTLFPVPTAGEVPIVQAMLASGADHGAAGVLLATLAPVSLPSLLMVARVFPLRLVAILAGLTALAGIVGGAVALYL